jgi:hypothetical protein
MSHSKGEIRDLIEDYQDAIEIDLFPPNFCSQAKPHRLNFKAGLGCHLQLGW